ncbi:MAG: D-Ala-D-Ala carboxypeptidase family metallohydrolase [Nannocystaceae bacterium]|nr:D-Ala-D-Ala carboxypeptidase family metallohydrolase [bacterium]
MRENERNLGARALFAAALLAAGCADDDERFGMGWDPDDPASGVSDTDTPPGAETGEPDDDGSTGGEPEGDEEGGEDPTGADGVCNPGMERQCLCEDGLHLGNQICSEAGDAWGACECDDTDDSGGSTGGDTDGGDDVAPTEVCYPGADGSGTTCFELHYLQPDGYDYPPALGGDPNYRQPIAYIDLEAIDPDTSIAPNFRLVEIAEAFKGRYAIVQPHAIESLQALRDAVGGITVNSGYRPPEYNASVGGATHSRHMYGDGFDLDPIDVGLSTLEAACTDRGGMLVEYNTHVHCDFRFDDVSVEFYGEAGAPPQGSVPVFSATLDEQGAGMYTAAATGFDEGEPLRRWYAYDASGSLIEEVIGPVYVAPESAARVRVVVGAQVELETIR